MRCATSWVGTILAQHPEIYFSPIKELHYFNHKYNKFTGSHLSRFQRIRREFEEKTWAGEHGRKEKLEFSEALNKRLIMKSDADYKQYFNGAYESKAFGEITPAYSLLPEKGYKDIKALFPEAKIIFGMRHPADRIWSHWCRLKKRKTHKKRDIKYYSDENSILEFMNLPCVSKRTDYHITLDRISSVFDRDSVLYYFYEDIFSDEFSTRTFTADLLKFLGVSEIQIPYDLIRTKKGSSSEGKIPVHLKRKIMEEYKPIVTGVRQRIGHIPDSWWE